MPNSSTSNPVTCPGPNNLPPLRFHYVHGDNIRISRDGALAKRFESFNKGVTFSDRPVKPNERVFIKFSEISNNWSGVIRFGFTYNDPVTFNDSATSRNSLPKYACPDLTNRPGFWAKALNERYCERDNILFYYFTSSGDVHFGINGEEKGIFFTIPPPREPLWALVDVYGNCSAIEFLDSRVCMYQHRSGSRQSVPSAASEVEIDRIVPHLQSLSVNEDHRPPLARSRSGTSLRTSLTPVPFHRTRGRNVHLSQDKLVATRVETEFCQGYVFTARPIRIGEKLIVQVLRTEPMYVGALALGLTSCDPATLQPSDLPDDSDLLLDRPEYWVVSKDIASNPVRGDEIIFSITQNGEVQISKNDGSPTVIMHVDQSLQLWAFLDVYGSTQSVRVLSQMAPSPQYQTPISNSTTMLSIQRPISQRYASQNLTPAESISSIEVMSSAQISQSRRSIPVTTTTAAPANRVISSSDMIQLQSGGTVLVVNLPPANSNNDISGNSQTHQPQITQMPIPPATLNAGSITYSSNYVETKPTKPSSTPQYSSLSQWQDANAANLGQGNECTICYEHSIDSVLYTCGHMCMCYECAVKQWHGIGGGHCPLCRAIIRDVIRIYKS
ncbi:protein neuralized isoform X2 [Sitodiplosis mosellana]|uniref:protein neuralized isoform X2 n=1 Tax=Sitodiplosis mosellana TaxID=263140 RepID=UPI00244415CA|nr:protein neuralized isoform X2 [Sitodiplosis mosellana]